MQAIEHRLEPPDLSAAQNPTDRQEVVTGHADQVGRKEGVIVLIHEGGKLAALNLFPFSEKAMPILNECSRLSLCCRVWNE